MAEATTVESNDARRAAKLRRRAARDDAYRRKVAAQAEQRIRERNAELYALGFEPVTFEMLDVTELSDKDLDALANSTLQDA